MYSSIPGRFSSGLSIRAACLLQMAVCAAAVAVLALPHIAAAQTASPFPPASQEKSAGALPDAPASAVSPKKIDLPAIVNGRPYKRPTGHEQFMDYVNDSYGLSAVVRTTVGATFGQIEARTDTSSWPATVGGFGDRMGIGYLSTIISGNTRYGMETLFREDMRYIPCHGCSVKRKVENALLAEITARHDKDGHRFFTLTPLFSDMSGPVITDQLIVPGRGAIDGVVGSRVRIGVRIGGHLYTEFVQERKHHDPKLPD
jgi:hypothetical protein